MKRKVLIAASASVVVLVAGYVGGAYFAGQAAETTLQKQHEWLASLPYFIVKDRSYQRGWFSSTETTTLQLNPAFYCFALEKEGAPLPKFEVTYTQRITHGPLPLLTHFNLHPYKAVVSTDFVFAPETQKLLSSFFGEQKPITLENRIGFSDDGVMQITMPSFEHEEALSGIKAKWQGLSATVDYGGDFNRVKFDASVPGLDVRLKDGKGISFSQLIVTSNHQRGKSGLMLGANAVKLGSLKVDLPAGLLTYLPQGLNAQVDGPRYQGSVTENGELIDGTARFNIDKITLSGKPYGPAELITSARHLHGPTLAKLGDAFTALQKQATTCNDYPTQVAKLAREQGMPLLTHDPQLAIEKLEVKLPDGAIRFNGKVGLKGFQPGDLDKPVEFVKKLNANADFVVPRKVVETVIAWQATRMFGGADSGISQADLDYLAGQFVEGQINRLANQKLIRVEGDMLAATADLKEGAFTLNGARVPMPWEQPAKVENSKPEAKQAGK
ncbi:YdgA family protein [Andreprevotia chitinilytica]|uniref:YdgA family protein n=1 Tax=Andreprevotia chitinilytica TaxID=396808 RepID=UPI0014705C3D|nr:YdgA family protein [Andreprevotia chitinilytica]